MLKIGILGKIYYALIMWFVAGKKVNGRHADPISSKRSLDTILIIEKIYILRG